MSDKKHVIEGIDEQTYKDAVKSVFMIAKFYKDKYDALMSVGFSGHEALEIIKARGLDA